MHRWMSEKGYSVRLAKHNEEICDALVSAITSLKFTGLTGTDMSWNAEGQVSKAPTAYVVKDGQYVEG